MEIRQEFLALHFIYVQLSANTKLLQIKGIDCIYEPIWFIPFITWRQEQYGHSVLIF